MKSSTYYFYMKTKILAAYISVPLIVENKTKKVKRVKRNRVRKKIKVSVLRLLERFSVSEVVFKKVGPI